MLEYWIQTQNQPSQLQRQMDVLLDSACVPSRVLDDSQKECRRLRQLLIAYQAFVGHDLPNQLVSVQAYCNLLNESDSPTLDEEARLVLARLGVLSRRMGQRSRRLSQIGQLLREPVWGSPISLEEAAGEAIAAIRCGRNSADEEEAPKLDASGITFQIADRTPMLAVAWPLLHQVLLELLRNAIAAIGSTRPGRIDIDGIGSPAGGTIVVRDSGVGLSAERAATLADANVLPGLGLLLVHQAASLWGGCLEIASRVGEGTTMTVSVSTVCAGVGE